MDQGLYDEITVYNRFKELKNDKNTTSGCYDI